MTRSLSLAVLLLLASSVRADEGGPVVEFSLADGWVNLRLHNGDTPVSDAKILVLVGEGQWAEGETDEQGKGSFPKPNAETCQVVFVYSTGTSAPVPLTFKGDTLTPATAIVGGVKPPCCLVGTELGDTAKSVGSSLERMRMIVFAGVLLTAGAMAFVAYRMIFRGKK